MNSQLTSLIMRDWYLDLEHIIRSWEIIVTTFLVTFFLNLHENEFVFLYTYVN